MNNNKIKLLVTAALITFTMCLGAAAQPGGVDDPCRQFMGSGGRCQTVGSGGRMSQIVGSGAREDAGQILGSGGIMSGQDAGQIFGSGTVTGGGSGMIGSGTVTGGTGGGQTAEDGGYLGSGNRSGLIGSGTATGGGPSAEDCGGLIGSGTFTGCRNSDGSLSIWDWLRSLFA